MKTAVRMGTALVRGVNTQRRCCSGDVDLPSVVLLEGDAFVTDSFAKVKTDPKWVLDSMQGAVESEFYDRGIKKYENLAGWKPLSSTVNHLTCTHNLKVQGWSRHPQDTSKMVYALLNDAKSRSSPTTVIPHYQLDRVRDHWAKSEDNVPLYFKDVQGHSATSRATMAHAKQEREFESEYDVAVPAARSFTKCDLPEMFAIIAGFGDEDGWSTIKSNPPAVLQQYVEEAQGYQKTKGATLAGASPLTVLLNLLVDKYGCRIDKQAVTTNDLRKITFILEVPQ